MLPIFHSIYVHSRMLDCFICISKHGVQIALFTGVQIAHFTKVLTSMFMHMSSDTISLPDLLNYLSMKYKLHFSLKLFLSKKKKTKVVLKPATLILLGPLCRDMYGEDDPSREPERSNEAAGAYAQACIAVATELNHPVIDIWTKMQEFPDWQTSALR